MVYILAEFIKALWLIAPAYAANASPTISSKLKNLHPIDFGRKLSDEQRVFGDGKTIEGFLIGIIFGTFTGSILMYLYPFFNIYANSYGFDLPYISIFVGFMLSLGTLFGDLCGSFVKRRLKLPRGSNTALLDQLPFVTGAIIFSYKFTQINVWMVLILLIITPVIHRITCIFGYKLKLKKVPW